MFASTEDWGAAELGDRIRRSATVLTVLLREQLESQITDRQWSDYQHQFAGNAARAERTTKNIDFDSPLMRLAAGAGPERRAQWANSHPLVDLIITGGLSCPSRS